MEQSESIRDNWEKNSSVESTVYPLPKLVILKLNTFLSMNVASSLDREGDLRIYAPYMIIPHSLIFSPHPVSTLNIPETLSNTFVGSNIYSKPVFNFILLKSHSHISAPAYSDWLIVSFRVCVIGVGYDIESRFQ